MKIHLIIILQLFVISEMVLAQTNQFQTDTDNTSFRHRGALEEADGKIYAISGNFYIKEIFLGVF